MKNKARLGGLPGLRASYCVSNVAATSCSNAVSRAITVVSPRACVLLLMVLMLHAAGASCSICGKGKAQAPLTRTPCCQQLVCDTNSRYQVGSYSRDICPRSHERYTLCG
jgi:hypothetical protein